MCDKILREIFSFLPPINNSATIELSFSITKHISNHIIKCNQYFPFLIWIVFFNILINIIHIIWILGTIQKLLNHLNILCLCFLFCQLVILILLHMDLQHINKSYQYLVPAINILHWWSEICGQFGICSSMSSFVI